eukprot:133991_1
MISSFFGNTILLMFVHSESIDKYLVENNRILDTYGRECFFHGVNIVYKSDPYLPIYDHFDSNLSYSEQDMQFLNSLGLNVIRLGVMWPGVEPKQNEYNMSYISLAANMIKTGYTKYNITTLVDCHQDVLSEAFCGEGAPVWAMQPRSWNFPEPLAAPYTINSSHIPSREDCLNMSWPNYYLSEATSSAFQRLYENYNGLRDAFADYWGILAIQFKDVPGIIGFELLNEPWVGDMYLDPMLMYPGVADKKNLQPFYDAIAPVIKGNDSERIIFFESVTWTDEFNESWTETGFEHVPGGSENANKSVFSFHFYGLPNVGSEQKYFYERTHDGIKWNATSFLTEFGVDDGNEDVYKEYRTLDYCDEYFVSWIGWEYKDLADSVGGTCTGCGYGLFDKNGSVNTEVVKRLSRTYAQKIAGHIHKMKFDWKHGGNFTLVYDIDIYIREPTIIYVANEYWYPNGYNLKVEAAQPDAVTHKTHGNYIELYNSDNIDNNEQIVTVMITPRR